MPSRASRVRSSAAGRSRSTRRARRRAAAAEAAAGMAAEAATATDLLNIGVIPRGLRPPLLLGFRVQGPGFRWAGFLQRNPVNRRKGTTMASKTRGKRGSPKGDFLSDIQELRRRARQHIDDGAVTAGYGADREKVIAILNEALATEIVCVLRYKRHYFMATGIHHNAVAEEFQQHAAEEQGHADRIAERITQLGGEPNFDPDGLSSRSHSQYVEGASLVDMIREDLVA